jgi:Sulfotransferase domain
MQARTKPSLFLAGAPKAGTSALANFLAQDDRISVPRVKEPNFLCPDLDLPRPKSEEEYLSLFTTTPATRVLLDASILYLYSTRAAAEIAAYCPDARIIAILRNPVEAMYAWHGQMVYTGNEPITDFERALEAEADRKQGHQLPRYGVASRCPQLLFYRDVMRYAEQIERFLACFPRERLHIIRYEALKESPQAVFTGVLRFAGLEASSLPEFRTVNASQVRTTPALHAWLKKNFAGVARAFLPLAMRLQLIRWIDRWTSRELARPEIPKHVEAALTAECHEDVQRLEALLGDDLSAWYRG